jgi:hypothetical protein
MSRYRVMVTEILDAQEMADAVVGPGNGTMTREVLRMELTVDKVSLPAILAAASKKPRKSRAKKEPQP